MPARRPIRRAFRLIAGLAMVLALPGPSRSATTASDRHEYLSLRQFGAAEGLPQLTVLAIAKDAAGYLYVGTQDGLSRYDGQRFESIRLLPGVHDPVGELLATPDGLWVGSSEQGLFRVDAKARARPVPRADGMPWPAIEALARTRDGTGVWVGTPAGLFRCDGAGCRFVPGTDGLPVTTLLEGESAAGPCLWVGTNDRGVLRFEHTERGLQRSAESLDRRHGLPNSVVRALAHFPSSNAKEPRDLWIGTGRGVARVQGTRVSSYMPGNDFPPGSALTMTTARAADSEEFLYVGLYGGGLVRFDRHGQATAFDISSGLPERFLYSLLAVDQGPQQPSQLWIGTSAAGLLRQDPGRWFSLDERHVLPAPSVVSVGELDGPDGRKRIWAGTLAGAVVQSGKADWNYLLPGPHHDAIVYSALIDPNGRLWAGTLNGLLLVEQGKTRVFNADEDGLPGVSVQELLWRGGKKGELWIGTSHGLARWRDGAIEPIDGDDGRLHLLGVRALLPLRNDDAATVAIGTSEGLYFSDGRQVRRAPKGCLPHEEVLNLARAGDDALWVATRAGAAQVQVTPEAIRCRPLRLSGDGPKTVYSLLLDRQQRLYLFGYDGAQRIDNPETAIRGEPLRHTSYGIADGLPSLEFNRDAVLDRGGRIWAANNAGLVAFEPDIPAVQAPLAPLRVAVRSGGKAVIDNAELPRDHAPLNFSYRLLAFADEHRIRYRSRLLGLNGSDSGWTAASAREFSRLPVGDYRFQLEALDAQGRQQRTADFHFSVLPRWWQHPAMLGVAMTALLLLGLGIGRWRAQSLTRRAALLESEVAFRTDALARANQQLERAAHTDPMTGAFNRRHFHSEIETLLRDHAACGLWLLLVDIDHFKRINDEHGHAAGDAVLIDTARRLQTRIADSGWVVRWGGEEFLIACRAERSASDLCRALLDDVSAAPMRMPEFSLQVTCSLGITHVDALAEGLAGHVDSIVARADAALYRAKHAGRDRAVLASCSDRSNELAFEELPRR
jgi:diguanylate cyclase (GGDEF)-like protein